MAGTFSRNHSRSPAIFNAAFAALDVPARYEAIECDVEHFEEVVAALRNGELSGVNVTMPLKVVAAARCDVLTSEASASGSVNAMRRSGALLEGHSTDVVAMRALLDRFDDRPVLILGSGGAAAAVAAAAAGRRAVYLSGRTPESVSSLLARSRDIDTVPWGTGVTGAVLVNATPLGMAGEELPPSVVEVAFGLIDLPYGPDPTPAVAAFADNGRFVVDGLDVLAEQAVAGFAWLTGRDAPRELVFEAVRKG